MQIHILEEHKNLSNQELIKIYGPDVINNLYKNKKSEICYLEPSLTIEGVEWYEENETRKRMGFKKNKIPREFLYKLSGKRLKRKEKKLLDKLKKYGKINLVINRKRLLCMNHVQSVETKTQI
jgi:hypothetical protein